MKSIVVYESLWGNTAAVARAIAEGLGPGARALSTAEAAGPALAGADLIVVGSPVIGFRAPSDKTLESIRANPGAEPRPDLSQPSMAAWLHSLPRGKGHGAAFETGIWWSPGGAKGSIQRGLEQAGYVPIAKPKRFVVKGKKGPLREGELERAHEWGAQLAKTLAEAGARPTP